MTELSSNLADGLFLEKEPTHVRLARAEFLPWHRIHKQFIRSKQWNFEVGKLIKRYLKSEISKASAAAPLSAELADEGTYANFDDDAFRKDLRCLVIPGEDLLDVKSLVQAIQQYDCKMQYLGFNESHSSLDADTRIHLSNNEVTSNDRVSKRSQVICDRFQTVGSRSSHAYQTMKEYGPYHVINLDLCESLFPTVSKPADEYISAIYGLVSYQLKTQTTPWLLFITTHIAPSEIAEGTFQQYCKATRTNWNNHSDFAMKLGEAIPSDAFETREFECDISKLDNQQLITLFGVAVGKILIALGESSHPQWELRPLTSYRYMVNSEPHAEMLSLAFQFRRKTVAPTDPTELSTFNEGDGPVYWSEVQSAVKVVDAIVKMQDVDDKLSANNELFAEMRDGSAALMERSGYDKSKYLAWADEQHQNVLAMKSRNVQTELQAED